MNKDSGTAAPKIPDDRSILVSLRAINEANTGSTLGMPSSGSELTSHGGGSAAPPTVVGIEAWSSQGSPLLGYAYHYNPMFHRIRLTDVNTSMTLEYYGMS